MLICFGCHESTEDIREHRAQCGALADVTVAKVVRMLPRAAWK